MLTDTNLRKMGFSEVDAKTITELNLKHAHKIATIVKAYVENLKIIPFVAYTPEEGRESSGRASGFISDVQKALPGLNEYTSRLLGWINCIPFLYEIYKKYGINEELFFDTMKDFSYKLKECRDVHNEFGLFVDWFSVFFELKAIALGRLEFDVKPFRYDEYSCGDFTIKKGETVYMCHIPSSGKLTTDLCMDSFQRAYEFFRPQLKGDIIPIISQTWMFYEPYVEKVFVKGSNLEKFANLFDIVESFSKGFEFPNAWRIFNKDYNGNTENLPADNSLRQNFIKYINEGGDSGIGYGILLYNGKTKEIINKREAK